MKSWRALVLVLAMALVFGCAAPPNKPPSAAAPPNTRPSAAPATPSAATTPAVPATAAAETKLTPEQVKEHDKRAQEFLRQKDYRKALDEFQDALSSDPNNQTRLYNMASAYSLLNEKEQAVTFLKRAVEAGWDNFDWMKKDSDLDAIRNTAGYQQLLKTGVMAAQLDAKLQATRKLLASKGVDASQYRAEKSTSIQCMAFLYKTNIAHAVVAAKRKELEDYANYLWKTLLLHPPATPVCVVLIDGIDRAKVFRDAYTQGVFFSAINTLVCTCDDVPMAANLRKNTMLHEFTHCLHMNDTWAMGYQPSIWFAEGLATLYGSAIKVGDSFRPRFDASLPTAQGAVRKGSVPPWATIVRLSPPEFMANMDVKKFAVNYATSEYTFFYIYERGLLKKFYDEYCRQVAGNRDQGLAAQKAIEAAFGKPMAAVERDWREWVLKQQLLPLPDIGAQIVARAGIVSVTAVKPGSPAEKAGIRPGDQIRAVNGREVTSVPETTDAMEIKAAGDPMEVEIVRNGQKQAVKVTLEKPPGTK